MKFTIRPLTALAVVLSTLGAVQAGRLALNATQAWASQAETKAPEATDADPKAEEAPAIGAANTTPPPQCVPVDLAKEAGISAAEFRLLQNLQDRRIALDERERDIITREGIIKTADDIVRARIASLQQVEQNIQNLLGQVDAVEAQRLAGLVQVYEKMKPKDAARVMEGLSDEVLINIASRMKNQSLALILAKMDSARARQITTLLAQIDENQLADATSAQNTPAPTTPAAPAAANAPARNQQANNGSSAPSANAPRAAGANPPAAPAQPAAAGQAPRDPAGAGAPKAKR